VEQGEQAHGLSLLHKRAEQVYSHYKTLIEIPVIVVSSLTGFLSVGSTSMFAGSEVASAFALGVCSYPCSRPWAPTLGGRGGRRVTASRPSSTRACTGI
jgi:hypothetical protein